MFPTLPRTVIVLGFVSLLNDTASEMITPLLPLFLTATLGAGPAVVGLIEGVAEAAASILKLVSGWLADRGWNRRKLVIGGYAVSNIARPLIGLALGWTWVLVFRFLDRVGKGLRTAPRDAVIAASVDTSVRGRAFGFHRAMDHTGAMLGPLIAFLLLQWGTEIEEVFLLSIIPGTLLILLLIFVLKGLPEPPPPSPVPLRWSLLNPQVKGLLIASCGLAMASVPEAFLVLWAYQGGLEIVWVPLLWAFAHGVKALIAAPAGALSDRLGRIRVVFIGWVARFFLLIAFAQLSGDGVMLWGLFLAFMAASAFSEGAERALIGDFAPADQKATDFGIYHLLNGLLILPAALLFGVLWQWFGMTVAFFTAAFLTALSSAVLLFLTQRV